MIIAKRLSVFGRRFSVFEPAMQNLISVESVGGNEAGELITGNRQLKTSSRNATGAPLEENLWPKLPSGCAPLRATSSGRHSCITHAKDMLAENKGDGLRREKK
jgi:hypothetical protein